MTVAMRALIAQPLYRHARVSLHERPPPHVPKAPCQPLHGLRGEKGISLADRSSSDCGIEGVRDRDDG
jgi:hypothetical protein